jgi:hypothetical protein
MKRKSKLGQWLGVFTVGAGLALSVSSSRADSIPTVEVTIVVSSFTTGKVLATFDSGQHTGPAGITPAFSPSGTQVTTGFFAGGGVTIAGGEFTADNKYPDITGTGLGQYLESIVTQVTNSNAGLTDVDIVVSANNFVQGTGVADNVDNLNLTQSWINATNSGASETWYEDDGNRLSTAGGTVGSAPVFDIHGSQVGRIAGGGPPTGNGTGVSGNSQYLGVNFNNPFSMTLFEELRLSHLAVLSNTSQAQFAQAVAPVPLPGTRNAGLALMGVLLAGEAGRRLREARPATA